MRCLVTGGAGFIGSHLVQALIREGHEVRVFDNFLTGRRENLVGWDGSDGVEVIEGDIRDPQALRRAMPGVELVFHQAALPSVPRSIADPVTTTEINATGTLNVLEGSRAAGVRRLIYASSSSVYGNHTEGPKSEEQTPSPLSPYAASKLAGEAYCRTYAAAYGLHTVGLRYFNVFGPRQDPQSQYAAVIPRFITAMLAGRAPVVFGDGGQTRDFTFVENVVALNLLAARAPAPPGTVYNGACGQRYSLNQVLEVLRGLTGYDGPLEFRNARPGEVRHSLADISSAKAALGYRPLVDFATGLALTVAHFRPVGARSLAKAAAAG